jgi:cellulose synthase/poly-beta-1,6-N-acetylglucosamine synthase-like glycosyltransferase
VTLALDIAAGLAALLWLAAGLLFLRAQSRVPSLEEAARRPTEDPRDDQPPPRVAAVVAGRDDADTITDTVADLLAQRAVEIRVVGVDDRSADDTLDRLNDLARSDPRLVPVRVDALPEGWLGKPHALTRGVEAARADEPEWLFFTDSDVRFEPDALALAIRAARRMNAHHLCAMPGLGECAVTGEANLLMHAQAMATQMARVNADRPGAFVGVGAFNLVRVCAYDAVGGHNTLRMEIVEDVKLASARGASRPRDTSASPTPPPSAASSACSRRTSSRCSTSTRP